MLQNTHIITTIVKCWFNITHNALHWFSLSQFLSHLSLNFAQGRAFCVPNICYWSVNHDVGSSCIQWRASNRQGRPPILQGEGRGLQWAGVPALRDVLRAGRVRTVPALCVVTACYLDRKCLKWPETLITANILQSEPAKVRLTYILLVTFGTWMYR